jgi:hypothetical protein
MKQIRYFFTALTILMTPSLLAQGYLSFGYGPSIPVGKSSEYIDKLSWRGFNMEAGAFVTRNISVGAAFSWYGSYKSYPYQTYENIQGTAITITGHQWRYENVYPLVAVFKYYIPLKNKKLRPFIGAGLGPYFINRSLDFGIYSRGKNDTQFGFYPELGLSYWMKGGYAFSLDAKYNYSIKTNDLPSHSNIAINLGLVWKFGGKGDFTFTE